MRRRRRGRCAARRDLSHQPGHDLAAQHARRPPPVPTRGNYADHSAGEIDAYLAVKHGWRLLILVLFGLGAVAAVAGAVGLGEATVRAVNDCGNWTESQLTLLCVFHLVGL